MFGDEVKVKALINGKEYEVYSQEDMLSALQAFNLNEGIA